MMKNQKRTAAAAAALALFLPLAGCGDQNQTAEGERYRIGICSYVDDASLNQIVENVCARLQEVGAQRGVTFEVEVENASGDNAVMEQIIANFQADGVDLMVGVATPVAMKMQAATEDSGTPVIFSAVSDPVGAGLVDSLEAPGANITGTSDYLDTDAVMDLIFAAHPEAKTIGLLYDPGQDSSTAPVEHVKAYLNERGVACVERTGTTVDEVMLAAQALAADGVDAVFTPTDNTVMKAELSIYETFLEAGIPHYTGADSFALNGAFLGYGVDYANLGVETADMVVEVLLDGANPAEIPVRTFDNGTATINTETCAALGYDYAAMEALFRPMCTKVEPIRTAESFGDLEQN